MLDDLGLLYRDRRHHSPRECHSLFMVRKCHIAHVSAQEVAYDPYRVSAPETLSRPEIPQTPQTAADHRSTAPSRIAPLAARDGANKNGFLRPRQDQPIEPRRFLHAPELRPSYHVRSLHRR